MKLLQVFEVMTGSPSLPSRILDPLTDYFNDISNDCYRRWYTSTASEDDAEPWMAELNQWLIDNGMKVDESDKYFHVLLRFDW